jgi:hypothetical protein
LNRTQGPRCKFYGIKLDFEFFFNRKIPWTGCTGLVDHNRAAVYGSTVDHGQRRQKRSPECGLGAVPVSESSPAVGEKGEETFGILTRGKWGRCDDGGAPMLMSGGGGAWSSVGGQHGRGWSESMRGLGPWCGDGALGRLL